MLMLGVSTASAAPPQAIPLLAATLANDIAAVRHRLDAGDDPNLADDARNTALIYTARDGRTEIACLLLARDVNRDHHDQWGRRAIDYARRRGPEDEVLRLLAE